MQLDKVWLQKTISIKGRSVATSESIWRLQNIADLKLKSDSDATELHQIGNRVKFAS